MKANSSLFRVILLFMALFAFTDALALTVNPIWSGPYMSDGFVLLEIFLSSVRSVLFYK
jgi:hypothetical protein